MVAVGTKESEAAMLFHSGISFSISNSQESHSCNKLFLAFGAVEVSR